jgi:hypothetical protein
MTTGVGVAVATPTALGPDTRPTRPRLTPGLGPSRWKRAVPNFDVSPGAARRGKATPKVSEGDAVPGCVPCCAGNEPPREFKVSFLVLVLFCRLFIVPLGNLFAGFASGFVVFFVACFEGCQQLGSGLGVRLSGVCGFCGEGDCGGGYQG